MKMFSKFLVEGFFRDLTQELESMKQLLKEIVNKITQNLLGKSSIESSPERVNNDISHSVYHLYLLHNHILSIRVKYPRDLLSVIIVI